ncbi:MULTISPECIES: KAP family P-loop NTPase fold protein [Aeromonas]|uniref:KAP family P-loop NTPase fold protein n=1 Tax=Aeromonas TaxID=642 RepID=UPI0022EA6C12|nr:MULTISPECIES: P-loop NTPase fold protein [Aeromonas]MDA3315866.1 KAP family NTPase [Aeromonas sp. PI_26]
MAVAPFNWDDAVQWDGPGAIAGSEEILSADRLDRARYAEFLTKYLAAEGKQRNYVLNLNAEWGAGKTWFIKRWYMELKAHYPTVYIDAWQQDFSDDPLLTVISSIIDQLRDATGNKVAIPDGIKSKLLGLLKVGGKLVLKSAIKKAGLEDGDFSMEGEDADKLVDTLCSNHKERYESIQYLKNEIRQWVEGAVGLSEGELDYPAFILIDELDRCRPSYAVEMLETIKHIFDIPKVVFVLATDTEQLQHAIKVIYGEGFHASAYLRRFFRRQFSLKEISKASFIESYMTIDDASWENLFPRFKTISEFSLLLSVLADAFGLQLRDIEQYIDKVKAAISNFSDDFDLVIFSILLLAKEHEPDLYRQIVNLELSLRNDNKKPISNVGFYERFKVNSMLQFNLPSESNGIDLLKTEISISKYINCFFYSMRHKAQLVAERNAIAIGGVLGQHHIDAFTIASKEETLLAYHLANQSVNINEYQDLVELACNLK